jgi:indole-3-glycerol phosphate synthase
VTILDEILDHKRREVAKARRDRPPERLAEALRQHTDPVRGFRRALAEAEPPAVIAELKRRSPSKGLIRPDFEPVACARAYAAGGAAALSVLTDRKFFGGELGYLSAVREVVDLPLLRKDFVVDAYQIDEARLAGADAVLLIAAALSPEELAEFAKVAAERDLDALVEVHDEAELEVALAAGADLVGVNNRDLRTFEVDLGVTERLARRLPDPEAVLLVAESGIHTAGDVARLSAAGARAFLVGESLMRETDVSAAVSRLRRST